jgi:hypothetical protein
MSLPNSEGPFYLLINLEPLETSQPPRQATAPPRVGVLRSKLDKQGPKSSILPHRRRVLIISLYLNFVGRQREAIMTIYKKFGLFFLACSLGSFLGCAGIARFERESAETDRIQELLRNRENYAVHAAIWPGNWLWPLFLIRSPMKSDPGGRLDKGRKGLIFRAKGMSAGTSPDCSRFLARRSVVRVFVHLSAGPANPGD